MDINTIPKVINIKPIPEDYSLIVSFDNGVVKKVSLLNKLEEEIYEDLKNKILFKQVQVDVGGYGVSWNDDIDMSESELWQLGEELEL